MVPEHHPLCIEHRGSRPCVCDVIHQAQAADQRLVRDAMTEYMRRLALATAPSTDDYVSLGAMQALNDLLGRMVASTNVRS